MPEREPHYRGLRPEELPPLPRAPLHVILDNIRSAYNVGSMFRTADAAAVAHVHLCGMSAHPPHKKIEKTALGAQDYVPWTYYERTKDCVAALQEQGITVVALEAVEGAAAHTAFAWPRPCAVLFGNEVSGVKSSVLEQCGAVVRIPMHGHKNALNVATTFGIILFEVRRQWEGLSPGG